MVITFYVSSVPPPVCWDVQLIWPHLVEQFPEKELEFPSPGAKENKTDFSYIKKKKKIKLYIISNK